MITYKDSGVDVTRGEEFIERIKKKVKSTYGEKVVDGVGGFASLYDIGNEKYLSAGTDGVGTKLMLAKELGIHNTIGIDLVAMCVNDIICTGATPLFFLDYLATGKLELDASEQIIEGIVEGCLQSNMALIGGETAEMPGMYSDGEYDLGGFAVGEVMKSDLIDGSKIKEGDSIIGLASSGVHSNGYSLVRKLIDPKERDLLSDALTPTTIYSKLIHSLKNSCPQNILGLAHITGGGIHNIARINSNFDYELTSLPSLEEIPPIFTILKKRSGLGETELYKTFNMGIGFVIVTNNPEQITNSLQELKIKNFTLGKVSKGNGRVVI